MFRVGWVLFDKAWGFPRVERVEGGDKEFVEALFGELWPVDPFPRKWDPLWEEKRGFLDLGEGKALLRLDRRSEEIVPFTLDVPFALLPKPLREAFSSLSLGGRLSFREEEDGFYVGGALCSDMTLHTSLRRFLLERGMGLLEEEGVHRGDDYEYSFVLDFALEHSPSGLRGEFRLHVERLVPVWEESKAFRPEVYREVLAEFVHRW